MACMVLAGRIQGSLGCDPPSGGRLGARLSREPVASFPAGLVVAVSPVLRPSPAAHPACRGLASYAYWGNAHYPARTNHESNVPCLFQESKLIVDRPGPVFTGETGA
jgi:hypothetical protein